MNLVIDIGNNSLKAAFAEGIELQDVHVTEVGKNMLDFVLRLLGDSIVDTIAISCVGKADDLFFRELEKRCRKMVLINGTTPLLLKNEYKTPETLGSDRLIAAYAATKIFPKKNCMIFDFGTAVTIDFVTADKKFLGGNISPGVRSRFRSLNDYTQKLPLADIPETLIQRGAKTTEAIQAGVILGLIFEIEGYMRTYPDYIAIFTGGDANFFADKTKNPIFAICNLVLIGLAYIANNYG